MASETIKELTKNTAIAPKESPFAIRKDEKSISIGLPKELSLQENRIALTPEAVSLLTKNGLQVSIESGAGDKSNFSDKAYAEAGAKIVYSHKEVFENDIVLKIEPLIEEEFDILSPNSTLISTLNITSLNVDYFRKLLSKNITALAFEYIEDKVGQMPIIRAMSEIAGSAVLLIAAEYLSSYHLGKGMLLGGITGVPPTKVVVLGAGTVGEFAVRTAIGQGAEVKVFDRQLYRLQRLQYMVGSRISTSIIDSENLKKALEDADVVIGALRSDIGLAPMVVTEEMVSLMKPNSVIIDVSIDQGGCFETSRMTSHKEPIFLKHDIIHYCVPNIASRFAHTASIALSNIFAPFLIKTEGLGGVTEMMYHNKWFMKGVICHKGSMTNLNLAKKYNLKYKDLGLILSARF
ncbi:alanine dehydrogenase [Lacihabitans lacunae]|jgi:alanine dehydrogenase|uniref:alanine dehydrogenase n=1 Tax=Lacihabitans lacunae TaxID=1028214 RepID=A0ABV7YSG3_9BACT